MNTDRCEHILKRYTDVRPAIVDHVEGGEPQAAVLIGIAANSPACPVIFTRRAKGMHNHSDEICLPGGYIEKGDEGSASRAALREAEEEIGLKAHQAEVLGILPSCKTSQGVTVVPVLARITLPDAWRLQAQEVAEVLEVPLDFFLDPANFRPEERYYKGALKKTLFLEYGNCRIWGLTARIMRELRIALTE